MGQLYQGAGGRRCRGGEGEEGGAGGGGVEEERERCQGRRCIVGRRGEGWVSWG